jgi:uncharacterized RDD family membrane protein YckC
VVDAVVAPFVQPVVDAVDVEDVVDRIDVEALIERIDLDALLDRIDPDRLLDRVDPNTLLDRVDPDRLLDRVDPNRLLERVDVDAVMARVDVDAVMARVDVDAVMARVDVNDLVARTELGEIIARSTTGVFGQLVDTGRIAVMSFDLLAHGLVGRVLRRRDGGAPGGPGLEPGPSDLWTMRRTDRAVALQGRHAGVVSRFLAFLVDSTLVGALFGLLATLIVTALDVVTSLDWQPEDSPWLVGVLYVGWQFAYFAGLTAATGRTIGKAVLGVFVVAADGAPVRPRQAVIRTLAFPISFLLFGLGFLLGLLRRDRRQLHDLIGGTAVVYAWDAELARLRSSTPAPDDPA